MHVSSAQWLSEPCHKLRKHGSEVIARGIPRYVQYFAKNSLRQTREHLQPVRQMRLTIVIILEVYGLFEV